MDCVFCDVLAGKLEAHFIYKDKDHVAILDRYPLESGHCLLIPRLHVEKITDMTDDQVGYLFSLVPRIARAILRGTGAVSFNVGQNNGREARQIVPHVHIHIIPRYDSTGTNWVRRKIVGDDLLAGTAQRIRDSL